MLTLSDFLEAYRDAICVVGRCAEPDTEEAGGCEDVMQINTGSPHG